jgi:hypothetical protein
MAIHGFIRATQDLDLFVQPEDIGRLADAVRAIGFTNIGPSTCQLTKLDQVDGDVIVLDLTPVSPATEQIWVTRQMITWNERPLSVTSREGLIALKRLRATAQDLVDIERMLSDDGDAMKSIRRLSQLRNLCLSLAKAKPQN